MNAASPATAPCVGIAHLALALGGFAIGTTEFTTMGILPPFSRDLGVSIPQGGRAISAYALGVVVGAPVLAVAGARSSRRAMLGLTVATVLGAPGASQLALLIGWRVSFVVVAALALVTAVAAHHLWSMALSSSRSARSAPSSRHG